MDAMNRKGRYEYNNFAFIAQLLRPLRYFSYNARIAMNHNDRNENRTLKDVKKRLYKMLFTGSKDKQDNRQVPLYVFNDIFECGSQVFSCGSRRNI
jgi:hypothetical protein